MTLTFIVPRIEKLAHLKGGSPSFIIRISGKFGGQILKNGISRLAAHARAAPRIEPVRTLMVVLNGGIPGGEPLGG